MNSRLPRGFFRVVTRYCGAIAICFLICSCVAPEGNIETSAATKFRHKNEANDAYVSLLGEKLRQGLNERPSFKAGFVVEVEFHLLADGGITRVRILKSSGSPEFDRVVLETLQGIKLPPRPPGLDEYQRFPIRGIEAK